MHFPVTLLVVICSSITTTLSSVAPSPYQLLDRVELESRVNSGSVKKSGKWNCTPENRDMRREWRTLSNHERKKYTDAVLCLRKRPSLYQEVKGSQSRFDDFQVVHINQTGIIHFNAPFLAWHRWFTWTFEQSLRLECGYKGFQPYWDWTLDSKDIDASPLFDGSPYSISGNGEFIPNRTAGLSVVKIPNIPLVNIPVPAGTGGGCVTTGPFANIQVSFGEVGSIVNVSTLNDPKNLDYKPHCLRRDLNTKIAAPSLTGANVETLLQSPNITVFNKILTQGSTPGILGLHGGGHFTVGRDMRDTWTSPGDPAFYLHHAQVDRLWTLWQEGNLTDRQYAISGTGTFLNYPPSPVFMLNDTINLGKLSPEGPRPIRDFLNTFDGPFCYGYA